MLRITIFIRLIFEVIVLQRISSVQPMRTPKTADFGFSFYAPYEAAVETAFLASGILMVREYFKDGNAEEQALAKKCDELWKGIEWNWYTKGGEKVLYWHWSPNYGWEMNFPLEGYNECLITYILAASSPTHSIDAETYYKGWTRNGAYLTDKTKYGLPLYVKHNYQLSIIIDIIIL